MSSIIFCNCGNFGVTDKGHNPWVSEQEADNTVSCDCGTER